MKKKLTTVTRKANEAITEYDQGKKAGDVVAMVEAYKEMTDLLKNK